MKASLCWVAAVTAAIGCTASSTGPGSGPDAKIKPGGDADAGDEASTSAITKGTHFEETGNEWTLPSGMPPGGMFLVDVDGDGMLDGLETNALSTHAYGTNDGDAHFRFARNDGNAFPSTFAKYAIPRFALTGLRANLGGEPHVSQLVQDFDGDGIFDYVDLTKQEFRKGTSAGIGSVGAWDFSTIPNAPVLRTADVNGDKLLDFLFLDFKNGIAPFVVSGASVAKVVRTKSGGFGAVENWSFPSDVNAANVDLSDFDGDGKADLYEITNPKTGIRVWKNTGSGFDAAPVTYAFPAACYCSPTTKGGDPYTIIDLDGDGLPDLVEPADWKAVDDKKTFSVAVWGLADGKPYWKYYPNDGRAFATEAKKWRIPVRVGPAAGEGYNAVTSSPSLRDWTTIDFNGDKLPDLVDTSPSPQNKMVVYLGAP